MFSQYSFSDRIKERANLEIFKEKLEQINHAYESIKFADVDDTSEYKAEVDLCFEYELKIRECLLHLNELAKVNPDTQKNPSLLKQPCAPLPQFNNEKGDDLSKFLKEFELTTGKYRYADRDLLLLLVQQVHGSAKTLLKSLGGG